MRRALVPVLLAFLALTGCGGQSPTSSHPPVAHVSKHDADGLNGVELPKPYAVPDVSLVDASGKPFDLAADATKPLTLVFFGYTDCPDICQVVMANIASALVRLDDRRRENVAMVFVTTDPGRDTPSVLRSYLDRFDPGFQGVTGDLSRIIELGKSFDVPIRKGKKLASGGYDVAHGTQIIGMQPDHTAPYVWTEGTAPGALADDLTKILAGGGKASAP